MTNVEIEALVVEARNQTLDRRKLGIDWGPRIVEIRDLLNDQLPSSASSRRMMLNSNYSDYLSKHIELSPSLMAGVLDAIINTPE